MWARASDELSGEREMRRVLFLNAVFLIVFVLKADLQKIKGLK